ncbi:nuclear transport factor 2 family protein [Sneathiella sp.]|jgi:steroid delta-isomerase|uniref:nuclear transport factor 2 family protein n=1 Tax=Sneathiella sp. TaxID=1964365 RepID=UPI0039E398D4
MKATPSEETCKQYISFFENLSPETVSDLDQLTTENLYFEDPFNRLQSRSKVIELFSTMFDHLEKPKFSVNTVFWDDEKQSAVLKWEFDATSKKLGAVHIRGVSELLFNENGLIHTHVDYWDSSLYFFEKIPVLGTLIRWIKRPLRLS